MGMKNDVSFLLDQVMNLWEQQSTANHNMPIRFLLYYAHVMERYLNMLGPKSGSIYANTAVQLPTPRVVLFYNGPGTMPDYLYLSDAYGENKDPDIELRVRVITINTGHSQLLDDCQPLRDYSVFVEGFRRYRLNGEINSRAAANKAIADLSPGVVKEYLIAHESEVVDMLLTEYDEEKTLKAIYYEGERAGLQEGLRMLIESVARGDVPVDMAMKVATGYGVADEADFRTRAAEMGIRLPE